MLSLGVHPRAQGRGVGRALLARLLELCDADSQLTRLELYVRADNERAQRLYASLGFEQEGVRRRFVRLEDGRYVDDWIMARFRGTSE